MEETDSSESFSCAFLQASYLPEWHGFVYTVGRTVVGFVSYSRADRLPIGGSGTPTAYKVNKLIVVPGQRGRGYGSAMLCAAIGEIRQAHPDAAIYIDTYSTNAHALRTFARCGFIVHAVRDRVILMRLRTQADAVGC